MLQKFNLLLVSVLFTAFYGFSQAGMGSIKGIVTDADTKQPIAFCKVILFQNGNVRGGAQTDMDGAFTITTIAAGVYDVEVRNELEGYKPTRTEGVIVSSEKITFLNDITLSLADNVKEMEEVSVVIYKVPLIDRDGGASGATITREDIAKMPIRDAAGVAQTVGGVNRQEGSGDISVRGSRSDGTYYYIDGIKVRGSSTLPKAAMEEVTVITGGLPANYGDVTGGIIAITTRGPSPKYFGSLEAVSSGFYVNGKDPLGYDGKVYGLDKFGYNLVEGMLSGPLWMQKDSLGNKTKPRLGFLVSANYTDQLDSRPSAYGNYRIKKSVRDELLVNPVRKSNDNTGIVYNSNYLTANDFEKVDWRMNARNRNLSGQVKIDVNAGPTVNLSFGGSMNYVNGNSYNYTNSLMNFDNFGRSTTLDWRVFGRLTQRFVNDEEGSSSKIKSFVYSLMLDYSKSYSQAYDPDFKYNLFNYGYVGKFDVVTKNYYEPSSTKNTLVQTNFKDVIVNFTPSDINSSLAAITSQYYQYYANDPTNHYENLDQILAGNALINGYTPQNVYGIWYNIGTPYDYFGKTEKSQMRATGSFGVNIGDHALSFGFELEQRTDRGWSSGTSYTGGTNGPSGLWKLARQLQNKHIEQLDFTQVTYTTVDGSPAESYARLNTGYAYTSGTGAYGGEQQSDQQSFFDYNLRVKMGLNPAGTDVLNIDGYDPNMYSLGMFSVDELLNSGASYVSYYGYDYTGKKVRGTTDISKYFNEYDANGNYKRFVGAYQPTYLAFYGMDKFAFKDLIFNVGVRVDVFDANQPVLKDPYLVNTAKTVAEVNQLKATNSDYAWVDIPTSMGDDYVVYVNDASDPTAINGYRSGNTWYNSSGSVISDPATIEGASGIQPWLNNPSKTTPDVEAFEDYSAQVNVMPRIAFSFPISDQASFFAHYDILTQRPYTGNRFDPFQYQYMRSRSAVINNSNLKPEKTTDYELGFQQVLTKTSALKVSAFYKEMRNQIQLVSMIDAYPATYKTYGNRDFGTVKGMTVSYDLRRTGNVRMTVAYTLQFADGTGSDATSANSFINAGYPNLRNIFPYNYDQRHAFAITMDYRYGEGKDYNGPVIKGFNVLENMGLNILSNIYSGSPYSSQQSVTNEAYISPNTGGIDGTLNGSRLPWQYRLDLVVDRTFNLNLGKDKEAEKKKEVIMNVYLRVTNLFNQFNVLNVYRATGNWNDDGYLAAASSQTSIQNQIDEDAFRNYYTMKLADPTNLSVPRTIRLGVKFDF